MIFRTLSVVVLLSSIIIGVQFRLDPSSAMALSGVDTSSFGQVPADSEMKGLSDSLSGLIGSKSRGVQTARLSKTKFKWMRFKFWINRNQDRLLYTIIGSLIAAVLFNIWLENRRPRRRR